LAGAEPELDLDAIFDPVPFVRNAQAIVARLEALTGPVAHPPARAPAPA
jgi:hypothetical protein